MRLYQLDPITDTRWMDLVNRHPSASVFHSTPWLKALQATYGYQPVVFTTSPPNCALSNGIVFCRIKSWITGRRLVSLPFSDHCEPLCDSPADLEFLIRYLQANLEPQGWRYLELRPVNQKLGSIGAGVMLQPAAEYALHILDLQPATENIFEKFDKDSVQRRIRRAERAGLQEESGDSANLLNTFYELFVMTRARHLLPPIPKAFFRNLIRDKNGLVTIRVAFKDGIPLASILTLHFKNTVYYKYGCSDRKNKGLAATPWLLWRAIQDAKSNGAATFDLGRTDRLNSGLLMFKNNWVRASAQLTYWKYPAGGALDSMDGWKMKFAKRIFARMPHGLLKIVGKVLYRHIG